MLCILPLTKLALEGWDKSDVADASALFNLMRNLGGAIGIAMIDTLIETRTALHASDLGMRLQSGDTAAARLLGIPTAFIRGHIGSAGTLPRIFSPILQRAALTQSLNEGWLLLAALFALALLSLPLIKR